MPNTGKVDFRLNLIDNLSKEMKKTQRLTESSLKSMSKEQIKLTKTVHKYDKQIIDLRNEQFKASKERKKQIREEIRLLNQLNKQTKIQLRDATRQHQIATKTTFSDRIGKASSSGVMSGLGKVGNKVAAGLGAFELAKGAYAELKENTKIERRLKQYFQSNNKDIKEQLLLVKQTASAFDQDYNEVLISANTLAKEMGISATESLKLIKTGFMKGADANGEFLDMLKEYPTQLKSVGLSAEESIALMTQQVNEGIYSDKGIDAIKEAGLRLKANNKATATALKYLKQETQLEVKRLIAKGKTFKAIQLISKGLKDTSLTAKQTQDIISDVFGGPGEDAGLRYLKTLGDVNTELNKVPDNMSEAQKALLEMSDAWEGFKVNAIKALKPIVKLVTILEKGIIRVLKGVKSFGKYIQNNQTQKALKGASKEELIQNIKILETAKKDFRRKYIKKTDDDIQRQLNEKSLRNYDERINALKKELQKFKSPYQKILEENANKMRKEEAEQRKREKLTNTKTNPKGKPKGKPKTNPKGKPKSNAKTSNLTNISTSRAVKSLTINIEALIKASGQNSNGVAINSTTVQGGAKQMEAELVRALTNVVNNASNQLFQ